MLQPDICANEAARALCETLGSFHPIFENIAFFLTEAQDDGYGEAVANSSRPLQLDVQAPQAVRPVLNISMLDPINALAFSLQANQGVYAVLLGSGVSRAADIPTGWEITLELVRKVALLQMEDCEPDPVAWYVGKTGKQPDYSDLLELVAKTPAERQNLLRSYWEPTEEQRAQGLKTPTKAHRAVSSLVKDGYIRVIVTTNFDRLMEVALQDVGVQPAVLSSVDHITGAVPLAHAQCTLIKVHGDYLDTRMLNTPRELATYPDALDRMLDRVFDEYGLIVCGWSAEWDVALRAAIERQPSRRYSTYWALRGKAGTAAGELFVRRAVQVVPMKDADSFFTEVTEQVNAIADFGRPHPMSAAAAVSSLKRYMSEPKYAIQLHDLIQKEVDKVLDAFGGQEFSSEVPQPTGETVAQRLQRYEATCETLMRMAYHAGYWSSEEQATTWQEALRRLSKRGENGFEFWKDLQRYPATLVLYAFGMGAVMSGRYAAFRSLLLLRVHREYREPVRLVEVLPAWALCSGDGQAMRILPGMERRHTPLNDRIASVVAPISGFPLEDDFRFSMLFDTVEVLIAVCNGSLPRSANRMYWTWPGRFGYRRDTLDQVLKDIQDAVGTKEAPGPLAKSGLIGDSVDACEKNLESFVGFMREFRFR